MASLFDNVVSESKVYKGAGRIVWGAKTSDGGPAFPEKIEDVINLDTFVLASGWTDLGATTRDGVSVTRSVEMEDGVETDQLAVAILTGTPKKWAGQVGCSMLHTDVASLQLAFESPAASEVGGSEGTQYKLAVGSPTALTERQMCVIQKHSSENRYRMLAFRRLIMASNEIELALQAENASKIPMKWDMNPDLNEEAMENMFVVYEMTEELT
jgi:hypothetical protein